MKRYNNVVELPDGSHLGTAAGYRERYRFQSVIFNSSLWGSECILGEVVIFGLSFLEEVLLIW